MLVSGKSGSVLGDVLLVSFSFEIDTHLCFPYILSQKKIVSYSWTAIVDGEG